MKKTTLTLVLTLVLLATFSTVAMASPLQATVERLNPNNPEVKEAIDTNFNYIYMPILTTESQTVISQV